MLYIHRRIRGCTARQKNYLQSNKLASCKMNPFALWRSLYNVRTPFARHGLSLFFLSCTQMPVSTNGIATSTPTQHVEEPLVGKLLYRDLLAKEHHLLLTTKLGIGNQHLF